MGLRLNLGSGGRTDPGWMHVDRWFTEPVVGRGCESLKLDIVNDPWPWSEGSVEGIVMHHVVDLLTENEMRAVLANCYRVLEPGGVLRVSCADITKGIEHAMAGDWKWFVEPQWTDAAHESSKITGYFDGFDYAGTLGHFILQGGARKQLLPQSLFMHECREAGFRNAYHRAVHGTMTDGWITELDDRADESWFVDAVKDSRPKVEL